MLTGDKLLKVYNNKHNWMFTTQEGHNISSLYFEILYAQVLWLQYVIIKRFKLYTCVNLIQLHMFWGFETVIYAFLILVFEYMWKSFVPSFYVAGVWPVKTLSCIYLWLWHSALYHVSFISNCISQIYHYVFMFSSPKYIFKEFIFLFHAIFYTLYTSLQYLHVKTCGLKLLFASLNLTFCDIFNL